MPPPPPLTDFSAETGKGRFHPGFQAAGEQGILNTLSHEACSGGSRGVFSAVHRYCRAVGLSATLGLVLRNAWLGLFLVFCIAQSAVAQTSTAVTVTPGIMYEGDGGSRTDQVFTFTHASVQSGNQSSIHHDQTGDGAATYPTDYATGNLTRSGTTVTFNLVAIGDYVTEGDERIELRIQLTNSDNSIDTYTTSITLKDGPPPSVLFNRNDFALTEGNAVNGSYGYTVKLSTDPGGTVTVTATSGDSAAVTVKSGGGSASGTTSLTFNSSNYSTAQTITAEAVGDSDSDDETVTIAHAVSATAGPYAVSEVVKFREELSGRQSDGGVVVTVRDAMKTSFFGVTVSPVDITLVEGGPSKTYTVKLDADPGEAVTIWASPGDVSRVIPDTGNCDVYNNCHMTFDSSTWQTAQTVTIRAPEDLDAIDNRIIVTNSGTHSDGRSAINRDLIVTVEDNDVGTTPGITLDTTGFTVQEDHPRNWNQISSNSQDAHSKQFNFRLDSDPGGLATVTITSDNAAVEVSTGRGDNVNHFVLGPTGHSEPWNQLYRVTLTAAADTNGVSETARIVLSTSGYSGVSEVLTVQVEDDDVVSLSASKTRLTEGGSDGTALIYAHVGNYTGGDLSIPIRVRAAGTTATSGTGNDFVLYSTPVTVANGSKQSSFAGVDTEIDQVDEPDETIVIELGPLPSGKVAGTPSHLELTLVDSNPTTVTLAAASTSINESGAGNKTDVTVTLGRTLEAGESVTVPLSVTGAAVGTHYTFGLKSGGSLNTGVTLSTSNPHSAQNPALTFGSGAQVATLELVAVDNSDTTARTVSVAYGTGTRVPSTALGGGLTLSGSPQAVGITDDDGTTTTVAQFASGSSSAGENAGTRNVTINLNPAPSNAITVNYTLSGSATRGTDYTISGVTSNSGSVSVSAGATSATIPVAITDDNTDESNETVILTLGSGSNYTIGSVNAYTLTITDNDGPPHSLSPTEIYEGERLTFTFSTNHVGASVGVWFRLGADTLGSTAAYATDYHAYRVGSNAPFQIPNAGGTGGQFTLSNGQLQFDIQALADSTAEGDETIMVAFYDSSGNAQITRQTITLKNGVRPGSGTVAQFASGSSSAAESAGTRNMAINLNPAPSNAITLNYTVGGTASEGGSGDFTIANSGTVSVSANASSVNIPVALRDDTTDEPRETVVLTLTQGSGYTVGSTNAHTLTITDNDITTVTLSTPDTTAEEQNSGNTATLRLALNRGLEAGETLVVPLRFSGGTAGTHFRLACPTPRPTGVTCANLGNANAAVTFTGPGSGASATAVSLTLSVPNDDGDTSDRTVTASIPASTSGNPRLTATGLGGGASGSRSGNGQIVLADDDTVRPTVTISAGSGVTEGTAASFTVSTSITLTVTLSVRVRVDDVPGSDFVASGAQGVRTVTIPANQASANFNVSTVGDSTDEASGPVSASVVNHASYVVGSPGTASVTVTDNDATTATLAGPAGDVREGNAKVLTLTLNRGLRSGESLTAPLSFAGAAGRNTDYTLSGAPATGVAYNNLNSGTATVVFTGPGTGTSAAVARITLRATADGATENPEAVDIGLGSLTPSGLDGGANGVDSLASFNIEDPPPVVPTVRFSSAASRAPEDAGTRNVTINLSPAPNTPLTLRYAVGGNAAGGDFSIANSGTLSVDSGDTAATIAVTITDDIEDENDETVVLTLTSDATYTIGSPGAHTLTIGDDDTTPVAAFASGASSVGEGAGTVNVAVRLTPPPQEDVTVNYAVADGTATAGSDYTRPSGTTLSFATGTATATIAIPIIDDNAAEGAETVVLTLGGCTGCTLGRATQHTLTIRSSDNPPTASDGTAATRPGQAYAFQVQDFGYRDPDGDALAHVTVVTLPAQGTLELGGTPVTAGARIPQARIASGDLTFTPEPGEKGEPYASFTFTVNDGSADSAASYTLALDVRNAPPEAADGEVQLRQGRPHTFRVEDFEAGYSDADGDRLAGIVIVAPPGQGLLALSGTVVTANDVAVTRGELEMGELTFTAAPGESGSPYTEFMFKVNDGFEDSLDSAKMTLHVQSVAAGRMIEQWLARFGRTVADQVIEAVEERLSSPQPPAPEASLQLRLAGRELDALRPLEDGQPMGEASDPDNPSTTPDASPLPDPRENLPARAALEASVEDALRPQRETSSLSLSDLDWLGGTSFRYARGDPAGGLSSVWGRGAISQFDGRDGSARVDGRVESLMLGADFVQDGRALGVLLSHSRGEGDYRGESGGRFDSDLTGIYPYARHEINDQLSVWGVAGYGEGELELRREASTEETDLELWMVAGGLRGQLCPGGWGWPELSALADVLWVETESDALGEVLPAADAQVSRVRIGVEGAWRALPLGDGQLSPRLRLSLRHDGGDAEHGFGTEVRAGLGWTDARRGLSAQLQAHALLTHEEDGAQEKGFSGSLAWDPRPGSLRGAEFSLTARTGDPLEQAGLLAHDSFERAAPRETRQAWQATLGYGVGAFGDRVTAVPQARLGWSGDAWDLGLGWRLVAEEFSLRLEAVRQDSETAGSDSRVQVQLQGRW